MKKGKKGMKLYRFENEDWFDFVVECESYEEAKKIYNHYRKNGYKLE